MNYRNEAITQRAEESSLWNDLGHQDGKTLPGMLERYLLLENWIYKSRLTHDEESASPTHEDI